MKNRHKKRWIVVGIVWSLALITFAFNLFRIESYAKKKEKLLVQERVKEFIRKYEPILKKAVQERNRMYDRIPSPKIGLMKVEELLNSLTEKNGLEMMRIEHEELFDEVNGADLSFTCRGAVKDLVKIIRDIDSTYPYLEISGVELDLDRSKNGTFKIKLKYNFTLQ